MIKSKQKKSIILIIVCFIFVVLLLFISIFLDNKKVPNTTNIIQSTQNSLKEEIKITLPDFKDEVYLVNKAIQTYMFSDDLTQSAEVYKVFKNLGYDKPYSAAPVTLTYSVDSLQTNLYVKSAKAIISEHNDLNGSIEFQFEGDNELEVYNLKTGTKYYYRIVLNCSNGKSYNCDGTFKTAQSPRLMTVDGVGNIRDIGGYQTIDGKHIKQGLLYRGTALDGASNDKVKITSKGVDVMLNTLKISFDMDLRFPEDNPQNIEPLGNDIIHKYYRCYSYSELFEEKGKLPIKKIFTDLADNNNYPMYIHCSYGSDRTGTVCYLLEAILGMNESDLMREYQLSGIYHGGVMADEMNAFISVLKEYKGDTICEKAENYLYSIGVTKNEINSIRSIFLE